MSRPLARWTGGQTPSSPPTEVDTSALEFDRVVVGNATGERTLSALEFLKLPLDERIRMNFERSLRFYRGDQEIATDRALRSLLAAARGAA